MVSFALFDLTGRVALVSGAASGMGRAMAIALAEAGADLMLADRNIAGAEKTADEIQKLGRRAVAVNCDVSDPEQIRPMFAQLDREFGRIDFLGNVAGDGVLGKPEEISLEAVEQTWRNLVFGRFCCCQEAGRRMLAAGRRQHRQHRLAGQRHGDGPRPYRLQHGDGRRRADDARAEHRMGGPRRARQRDPAGPGR